MWFRYNVFDDLYYIYFYFIPSTSSGVFLSTFTSLVAATAADNDGVSVVK